MSHKTATIETNVREKAMFIAAQQFVVKVGLSTEKLGNEADARARAEAWSASVNRGACLYASSEAGGALLATYHPKKGWKESDK